MIVPDADLKKLQQQLHGERSKQLGRGHDWDVADVMEVVKLWLLSTGGDRRRGGRKDRRE